MDDSRVARDTPPSGDRRILRGNGNRGWRRLEGEAVDNVSKQGDSEASLEAYRPRIVRHIRTLVRNSADAEDLAQETLLRAHRHLDSLKDPGALGLWLYRIATHVSLDFLRQISHLSEVPHRLTGEEEDPGEGSTADPEAPRLDRLVEQSQMSHCVQEFLEALPDSSRVAILLHDLHGLTSVEVARLLKCTPGSAKIRLHRARGRLRAALQAGCDLSHDERGVLVCGRKPTQHQG